VTQVIAVQSPRSRWGDAMFGTMAQRLIRKAEGATVHVVSQPRRDETHDTPRTPAQSRPFEMQAEVWLGSLASVAVAAVLGVLVRQVIGTGSISLLFLTAVLVSAVL